MKNFRDYLAQGVYVAYLLILLVVIGVLLTIGWVAWTRPPVDGSDGQLAGTLVSLLLTGITVSFASSVILPRVALKHAVDEAVNEALRDVERRVQAKFDEEGARRYENEIRRIDAHLSRMVAYFLVQGRTVDPLWGMGWIVRSARRYLLLDPKRIGLAAYLDLVSTLADLSDAARGTLRARHGQAREGVLSFDDARILLRRELAPDDVPNESQLRMIVRYLKEYFDFELDLTRELQVAREKAGKRRTTKGAATADGAPAAVAIERSRYPLFRLHASHQAFACAVLYLLETVPIFQEHRRKLSNDIADISYALLQVNASEADEHKERVRELQGFVDDEKQARELFDAAMQRQQAFVPTPKPNSTFKVRLLVDREEPYFVKFC